MDPVSLRETERPRDEPGYKKVIGKAKAKPTWKTTRSCWRIVEAVREEDFFPNLSCDFDDESPLATHFTSETSDLWSVVRSNS